MATPLTPGALAVFDFETTGLKPGLAGRVLEVAVVRLEAVMRADTLQLTTIDEWQTLIDPGPTVSVGAIDIHGIAPEHVLGAPTFAEIAGDLLKRLDDAVVVAHNAAFDMAFLEYECHQTGIPLPQVATLCTRDLARSVWSAGNRGRAPRFTLDACCDRAAIRIPERERHQSLGDARATAQLLAHLLDEAATLGHEVTTDVPRARLSAPIPSRRQHLRPNTAQLSLDLPASDFGRG